MRKIIPFILFGFMLYIGNKAILALTSEEEDDSI